MGVPSGLKPRAHTICRSVPCELPRRHLIRPKAEKITQQTQSALRLRREEKNDGNYD